MGAVVAIGILVVVASAIWVGVDHARIRRLYGWDVIGEMAFPWVFGVLLLWIIVFPIYLYNRGAQKRSARDVAAGSAVCEHCEETADVHDTFCSSCGAELPDLTAVAICPSCGTPAIWETDFCPQCGDAVHA